jgi:hypothetical protein
MQQNNKSCPVNFSPINQTEVRLVAFFVFVLAGLYCAFPHWSIAAILLVDFSCRAFRMGQYSLLGNLSEGIILAFSLPKKPVDAAAKEFAAVLGFILCDVLFIVSSLLLYNIGQYIAGILLCFSFVEAAFGICVGCYAFPYFQKFLLSKGEDEMTST